MNKNRLYDFIKFMGQIGLNAILIFIITCGDHFGWAITDDIRVIGTAFITLFNVFVIAWNNNWKAEQEVDRID